MSLIFESHFKEDEKIIEISHLSKIFGAFRAVDDISFEVKKGEIFGFLGANGAGKSTAMKILCGISVASAGTGRVAGFDINTQSEMIKKNIGYMSQKFSLYEDLKVWENIYYFGRIYRLTPDFIFAKMKDLLARLNFSDKKDEFVSNLPLGWKQKLAFCVANFHSPKIIFLDEPRVGSTPSRAVSFGSSSTRRLRRALAFSSPRITWTRRSIAIGLASWSMGRLRLWEARMSLKTR